MPDCFISYSSVDNTLAQFVNQELTRQGLTVFMASTVLTRIALVRGKYMPVSMENQAKRVLRLGCGKFDAFICLLMLTSKRSDPCGRNPSHNPARWCPLS